MCFVTGEDTGKWAYPDWIEAHLDSRLIYVYSCQEKQFRAPHGFDTRQVFEWRAGHAVLLRSEPFTPTRVE